MNLDTTLGHTRITAAPGERLEFQFFNATHAERYHRILARLCEERDLPPPRVRLDSEQDYPYSITVPRRVAALAVARIALAIDYPNFIAAVREPAYVHAIVTARPALRSALREAGHEAA